MVEAERKSNAMIADAEAKSTQILAEAIERARQLAGNRRLEEENTCLPSTLKQCLKLQLEQVKVKSGKRF